MKKYILIFFFSVCSCCLNAQYVQKSAGEKWGPNEELYSNYGVQVLKYLDSDMYYSAVDLLKKMIKVDCKNANRLKDYYTLVYCYSFMGDDYFDDLALACAEYAKLRSKGIGGKRNGNDVFVFESLGLALFDVKKDYKNATHYYELALSVSEEIKDVSWNEYMLARCHQAMNNSLLAAKFFKKAISSCCKMYNTTIGQVSSLGGDFYLLGETFYYYAHCVDYVGYEDWLYLIYLSAKCKHPKGIEEANKMDLLTNTPKFNPSSNLF